MDKLKQLAQKLSDRPVHHGSNYLAFFAKNAPHTVILDESEGTLIVSGNLPGGKIDQFDDVDQCFDSIVN